VNRWMRYRGSTLAQKERGVAKFDVAKSIPLQKKSEIANMKTVSMITCVVIALAIVLAHSGVSTAGEHTTVKSPEGWTVESPRDEICPQTTYEPSGGPNGAGCFVMRAKSPLKKVQSGNIGQWTRTVKVSGGQHYSFRALRKATGIETPRRDTMVRITWQDDHEKLVPMGPGDHFSINTSAKRLSHPLTGDSSTREENQAKPRAAWLTNAYYEFPADRSTTAEGWTEVTDVYRVPPKATQAKIELCLRWSPSGEVRWSEVSLQEVTPPKSRKARLATVCFRVGKKKQPTALGACRLFAAPIAEAARQGADLVCLPEVLTAKGTSQKSDSIAEPIPGPCSDYFGTLAKKHDLYIVAGLVEREGSHKYNTAALIGPDGKVVGKYRKVCLTRGESAGGYSAGREYPVFETRFGKVGMMICFDLLFPEVARNLSNNGAEVIALPIAGGDPILARARAIENQTYLVTSSYGGHGLESGVFGHDGKLLGEATDPAGSVCVVEVDLNRRSYWYWMGNLKNEIERTRPPAVLPK